MFHNAALILFDMGVPLNDGVPDSAVEMSTRDYKQMQIPPPVPAVIEQVIRDT